MTSDLVAGWALEKSWQETKTGAGHKEIGAPEAGIVAHEVHVLTPLYEDLYAGTWTSGLGPHF